MTKPPPENLMEWPKAELAREVERLRAITREHAERLHDESRSGGDSIGGSPHGRGDSVLDTRGSVLLEYNEVILVDTKQDEAPVMALMLEGRVNYETRQVKQMYLFGTDGAAALVSQIVGLAGRAGGEFTAGFKADLDRRMEELP
jgi:hypothetical protein